MLEVIIFFRCFIRIRPLYPCNYLEKQLEIDYDLENNMTNQSINPVINDEDFLVYVY